MDKKTLLSLSALALTGTGALAQQRMNVLFILTDDLQSKSIHALGCADVHTPNIDYIFSQGTAFTNCYTNGAIGGALSMPSRAMIMTGRGMFDIARDGWVISPRHTMLPEQLRSLGYRTFETGKWHSDYEAFNRAFSEGENIFFGGMHPYETGGHTMPLLMHYDPKGDYKNQKPFVGDKFSSEMYADAAVEFLQKSAGDTTPFFAYVAFTSPHDPRNRHPEYGRTYDPDTIALPVNYRPRHAFDNGELTVRDEVVIPAPRSKETVRKELADYYGMINEVDTQIGRVIEALRESGKLENTIVVFAGDNGLAMGQHGLMGKQSLYDHSVKVPLVVWAPGVPKGVRNDGLCYLYDINPTLSDLLGIAPAESVTGRSLAPAFRKEGRGQTQRNRLWLAYSSIHRALVMDGLKYIIYNVNGTITEQLFDLQNDPWEMTNLLAGTPSKKALKLAEKYRKMLNEEMRQANDFCDLDRPEGDHWSWWEKNEKISWTDGVNMYMFDK
ncbi:sulfatase-like hydrolase/transferase [Millionella massiliensis]|uniref:sulfatase-like hydrolase/transferase n=1 Tax=Millionella massiliensis TaxID=1871023 RepID=UPI0008D9AD93|nr:sulfatase-like hydrolase/transferase [Millionella massiliensis]